MLAPPGRVVGAAGENAADRFDGDPVDVPEPAHPPADQHLVHGRGGPTRTAIATGPTGTRSGDSVGEFAGGRPRVRGGASGKAES